MDAPTAVAADIRYWQSIGFRDPDRMSAWLGAIGFVEHSMHRDPQDPSLVVHAEWVWPDGAGIMGGSYREGSGVTPPGNASAYLVTDDPDELVERAVAAGGTLERPVVDQDYGGRGGTVLDPEGNRWSIGSYQPR